MVKPCGGCCVGMAQATAPGCPSGVVKAGTVKDLGLGLGSAHPVSIGCCIALAAALQAATSCVCVCVCVRERERERERERDVECRLFVVEDQVDELVCYAPYIHSVSTCPHCSVSGSKFLKMQDVGTTN
jgi:hypothetical protein